MNWICCQAIKEENETVLSKPTKQVKQSKPISNTSISQQRRRSVKPIKFPVDSLNSLSIGIPNIKSQSPLQTELPIMKQSDCSHQKSSRSNIKMQSIKKDTQSSIPGLDSVLIDDMIYVSQRPTSSIIQQYDLVNIFKEKEIALVINIQLPYENEKDKKENDEDVDKTGYSYSPAIFSSQGISVLQSGWKKYTVPESVEFILKIIREIAYVTQIEKKKVLLHSLAGINRTSVIIICYMVFLKKQLVDEALSSLQKQRKTSNINTAQRDFCLKFEQEITQMNMLFPKYKQDIATYLKNESALNYSPLSVNIENNAMFIPKIIRYSLNRIITLKQSCEKLEIYQALNGSFDLNDLINNAISTFMTKLTITDYSIIENSDSLTIISEVLYKWFNECIIYCINPSKISQIFQMKIDDDTIDSLVINTSFTELNSTKLQRILTIILSTLNKGEYELIKYISLFLAHLLPTSTEEIEEYNLMVNKLVIYLIGYNIDMLFVEENNEQYKRVITQTVALFHFLISSEIFNDKILCQNGQGYEEATTKTCSMDDMITSNISEIQYRINTNINNQNDKKLYEIYQSLKKHFEPKEQEKLYNNTIKKKVKTQKYSVTFSNNNKVFKS